MKPTPSRCLLVLVLITLTATALAEVNKIERYNWKKKADVKIVKIENPLGDIRLRFGGFENEFEIIAMAQHLESVGRIQIKENIDGDTYSLGLERIDKESGQVIALKQNDKARIDFTVYVPLGHEVFATTDHGLAEARKMKDPVTLSTQSGQIFLRDNKNTIQAKTVSGEIIANLLKIDAQEKQTFTTESGLIDIWLAEDAKQTVTMATSGDIIAEFSTQMDRDLSKEPNKTVTVEANGGGPIIEATSKRGQIALRVYPQL